MSDMVMTTVQKVVVYVILEGNLLVFRHLDFPPEEVGIQVPAGTIRAGETPRDAALRELIEETGFDCFEIVRPLGVAPYDMTPYRYELQERHFFEARTTAPLPNRWQSVELHDGAQPPTRLECFWIPLAQAHVLQAGQGAMIYALVDTAPLP